MAKTRTLQKKNFMDMFSGKQILIPIVALVLLAGCAPAPAAEPSSRSFSGVAATEP